MATDPRGELNLDDGAHRWWASVLDATQSQLRGALEEATERARRDVEATAVALARREREVRAMTADLEAERGRLRGEAERLAEREQTVRQGEQLVERRLDQARTTRTEATQRLSTAMARAAQLIEETQAQLAERTADASRRASQLVDEASGRADRIVDSARAVEEQSRAELERLVAHVREFLDRDGPIVVPADGEAVEDDEATSARVSDAVRRAVRGWSANRQQAS